MKKNVLKKLKKAKRESSLQWLGEPPGIKARISRSGVGIESLKKKAQKMGFKQILWRNRLLLFCLITKWIMPDNC